MMKMLLLYMTAFILTTEKSCISLLLEKQEEKDGSLGIMKVLVFNSALEMKIIIQ
jgi:hypothetical protein